MTLWTLANVISVSVAALLTYLTCKNILGWSAPKTASALSFSLLISLTWGTWASLVWTKTKALRRIQEVVILIPGVALILVGGFGFYVGIGTRLLWMVWILAGAGVISIPLILLKLNHNKIGIHTFSLPLGLLVYPLLTAIASMFVWGLWYGYIMNRLPVDWRSLISIATVFVSVISVALTTTIIPSLISTSLRRLSISLEQSRK